MPAEEATVATHRKCKRLLGYSVASLALATSVGFAGSQWWVFEIFSHFRLQYAWALLLLMAIAAIARNWWVFGLALTALLPNAWEVGLLYRGIGSHGSDSSRMVLRLLHLNAWHVRNREPESIAHHINSSGADVVLIQETSPAVIWALGGTTSRYRLVAKPDADAPFRSAILFRDQQPVLQLLDIQDIELTTSQSESSGLGTALLLKHGEEEVSILHPHVTAPGTSQRHSSRQDEIEAIIHWVQNHTGHVIVIGDLNSTPWSATFRHLISSADLINSQQGVGIQPTWPRRPPRLLTWMLSIPIDHCLHSRTITTLRRQVGPYVGSDHLPLIVTLEFEEIQNLDR